MQDAGRKLQVAGDRSQVASRFTFCVSHWGLALAFGLLWGLLVVSVVLAQGGGPGGATHNDVNRVAKQLYCPVCPNTPLDVCETQACQDWRELIRQKLSTGESDQQIVNYFVAQYGQRVLAQPTAKGLNLLVWLMPAIALIAGLAALVVILRSWAARRVARAPVSISAPAPDELPAEYVARVERELQLRSR